MGLLDDAIREHLDLKRRRGADPTEVEREEREVLGPVRRRGEPAPDDEPTFAHAPEDDLEHEPLPHPDDEWEDWEEEPAAEGEPAAFDHEQTRVLRPEPGLYEDRGVEAGREPNGAAEPSRYEAAERDMYAARQPEPYRAPSPDPYAPPEPSRYRADPPDQPPPEEQTAEFNVQDHLDEEHPPHPPGHKEEDVLEETPEFLQDTPDHDRLWFEQRPPRDFDFDG